MEYSYAENYLLNLYASLVKEKSYDKFKKIYDNIVIYILKKIILLQVILLRLLIFIML